jgi:amidohydrolase
MENMQHRLCLSAAMFLSLGAAVLLAQQTATEREVAREVVAKIDALERSIDLPLLVAKLTADDGVRDRVVGHAEHLMQSELLPMSDDITRHPEIGFKEAYAVRQLTDFLRRHSFEITMGTGGFETAFVARFKGNRGRPVMGIILEYDALRGTSRAFHGDQHSAQGPIGVAAGVAISEWLSETGRPGSVVLYGTPAEEIPSPSVRKILFERGVFNDADVIVRSHSSPTTDRPAPGFGSPVMNGDAIKYTFSGAPAHQASGWNGRNALEAVIHMFVNVDSMRSSIRPEASIQGVILEGGVAPNVVPDRTVADFAVRYPDDMYLVQLRKIVDDAARAAALSTQTKVKIETYAEIRDGISVASLAELGFAYMKKYGAQRITADPVKPQGYEGMGGLSRSIPGLNFEAASSHYANHTMEMESDALTDVGHVGFLVDAKAMTALLFDYASHAEYREMVNREFTALKALLGEYEESLKKAYPIPNVVDPK